MTTLVSVARIKDRLRIDFDTTDAELAQMAEEATDIVINYIKKPDHGWTEETVPPLVRAAILIVVTALHEEDGKDALSDTVRNLLHRHRDPAMA